MIYLWNMAMWRVTWGYIPVVWFPIDLPFITWHCTIPERVIEVSGWQNRQGEMFQVLIEYQRVAFSRSFLLGSAVPVFTQWIWKKCHQSFSDGTSSETIYLFHRFFHHSNVTTYHRGYIKFSLQQKVEISSPEFHPFVFPRFWIQQPFLHHSHFFFSTWDDRWNISTEVTLW